MQFQLEAIYTIFEVLILTIFKKVNNDEQTYDVDFKLHFNSKEYGMFTICIEKYNSYNILGDGYNWRRIPFVNGLRHAGIITTIFWKNFVVMITKLLLKWCYYNIEIPKY